MHKIVPFGCGVNSVAMVLLLIDQGNTPDLIIFADTGSEKPETYAYLDLFDEYLESKGLEKVSRVKYNEELLYNDCMRRNALPSIVYGFKSCSEKYKIRPANRLVKQIFKKEEFPLIKYVGYDTDEEHRIKDYDSTEYIVKYPLVEADMDRDDCKEYINSKGLPIPPKSACYFCPSSTPREIHWLRDNHPDLFKKAIEMERNAELHSKDLNGLGGRHRWEDIGAQTQLDFGADYSRIKISCECSY